MQIAQEGSRQLHSRLYSPDNLQCPIDNGADVNLMLSNYAGDALQFPRLNNKSRWQHQRFSSKIII